MKRTILKVNIRPHEYGEPGYFAVCPDLQGCHASGATFAEALARIQEAARLVLQFRSEKGFPDIQRVAHDEVLEGWIAVEGE